MDVCHQLASGEITIKLPKVQKTVVYGIAIAGGLGTYLLLGQLVGGGMGMPRFESAEVGNLELAWLIPLALVGTVCGWLYFVSEHASEALSHAIGERPVVKAMLAGLALAICGTVLPYTMFAGETQADVLMETYLTIPAGVLIATGLVKAMLTPALINLGWPLFHKGNQHSDLFQRTVDGRCTSYRSEKILCDRGRNRNCRVRKETSECILYRRR